MTSSSGPSKTRSRVFLTGSSSAENGDRHGAGAERASGHDVRRGRRTAELLGLYEGIAITRRTTAYSGVMPDVIIFSRARTSGYAPPVRKWSSRSARPCCMRSATTRLRRRLPARAWLLEAATRRRTQGRVSARIDSSESFGTSHCRRGAIRAGSVPHDSSGSGKAAGRSRAAAPRGPTHQRIFRREALRAFCSGMAESLT